MQPLDEEELCCPITQVVVVDPVIAADGHTYERFAIESWFSSHNTSPMTNEPVASRALVPNILPESSTAGLVLQELPSSFVEEPLGPAWETDPSRTLGAGGQCGVYLGVYKQQNKLAVKMFTPKMRIYYENERNATKKLRSKAFAVDDVILVPYGYCNDFQGRGCLAYKYMAGGTLGQRVLSMQPCDLCAVLTSALRAISELHFVHSDLKPENMMLPDEHIPRVLLTDCGFTFKLPSGKPPEQDNRQVPFTYYSKAGDAYAMGITIMDCLYNFYPQDNIVARVRRMVKDMGEQRKLDPKVYCQSWPLEVLLAVSDIALALCAHAEADRMTVQDAAACMDTCRQVMEGLHKAGAHGDLKSFFKHAGCNLGAGLQGLETLERLVNKTTTSKGDPDEQEARGERHRQLQDLLAGIRQDGLLDQPVILKAQADMLVLDAAQALDWRARELSHALECAMGKLQSVQHSIQEQAMRGNQSAGEGRLLDQLTDVAQQVVLVQSGLAGLAPGLMAAHRDPSRTPPEWDDEVASTNATSSAPVTTETRSASQPDHGASAEPAPVRMETGGPSHQETANEEVDTGVDAVHTAALEPSATSDHKAMASAAAASSYMPSLHESASSAAAHAELGSMGAAGGTTLAAPQFSGLPSHPAGPHRPQPSSRCAPHVQPAMQQSSSAGGQAALSAFLATFKDGNRELDKEALKTQRLAVLTTRDKSANLPYLRHAFGLPESHSAPGESFGTQHITILSTYAERCFSQLHQTKHFKEDAMRTLRIKDAPWTIYIHSARKCKYVDASARPANPAIDDVQKMDSLLQNIKREPHLYDGALLLQYYSKAEGVWKDCP
ncbi:hypothetical protein WJX72_011673 [[Myrmecia] bisecta]|uniref:RING-type E3 ubiquitin transferase n=1 Tax=[Myrmecia] bisecta TaxID=41462 RepID=A0AAW1PYA5_9CHLO